MPLIGFKAGVCCIKDLCRQLYTNIKLMLLTSEIESFMLMFTVLGV